MWKRGIIGTWVMGVVLGVAFAGFSYFGTGGTSEAAATHAAATQAAATQVPVTQVAEAPVAAVPSTYHLTGFRSAEFGMTEDQVRKAIEKDFSLSTKDINKGENTTEKTSVLDVTVKNLLPAGGDAHVSYIFGYQTHKLIHINVGWGAMAGPAGAVATLETLVEAANQLRTYLLGAGYRQDSIVANARMPDGTIIVFRGFDADNKLAAVVLTGAPPEKPADAKATDKKPELPKPGLQLSYVSDVKNPDIFHIKAGQF
ncbi:MAG: hypothetical protein WCK65_02585 [Rhodospirillaceae bacterium]